MKIIDAHIHIFPDDVAETYIENYSGHSNLGALFKPTFSGLLDAYHDYDVLKYVILQEWQSTIPFESANLKFMARPGKYYFYSYNAWLAELQRKHKNVVCFGGIHPEEQDRVEEFERMVRAHNLFGMKLPQCMQQFYVNDRRMFPVYERAQALDLPVLFHTGIDPIPGMEIYGHPKDVSDVATAFPNLRIIMAHLGTPFLDETELVLRRHEMVFADISFFIEIQDSTTAASIIKKMGVEKLMFGSDFPFVNPRDAVHNLLCLDLSDDEKEKILSRNAIRILKL